MLNCESPGFSRGECQEVLYPMRSLTESEARDMAALRRRPSGGRGGGRPCVPRPCPRCGAVCPSARGAMAHCSGVSPTGSTGRNKS